MKLPLLLALALALVPPRPQEFSTYEIWLDAPTDEVAAWQIDAQLQGLGARIVGIEGGDPEVFRTPPHHDPKAIQSDRVILAAFSTNDSSLLPRGRFRVASVHVLHAAGTPPSLEVLLRAAAGSLGRAIVVSAFVRTSK